MEYGVALTPELERLSALVGGVVGLAVIVDCATSSASRWYDGTFDSGGKRNYAFELRDARVLPFRPITGRLKLFKATGLYADGTQDRFARSATYNKYSI